MISIETVFEVRSEPAIVHCSTLVESADNFLLCVWYQGSYETARDTVLMVSRQARGAPRWSPPEVLFNFHGAPLGNPVLWRSPGSDRIHLTFSVLTTESWQSSLLFHSWSDDAGISWIAPTLFVSRPGFMGKAKPIPDGQGGVLFPLYHEGEYCPYIMLLAEPARALEAVMVAETMARGKAIQPSLHRVDEKRIIMMCRTNQGSVWRSLSFNNGNSWSILRPTELPNPDSAVDLFAVEGGAIGIVHNPSTTQRDVLAVAVSIDGGEHWNEWVDLVRGEGEFSYPWALNRADGSVAVSFTDNRYAIRIARIAGSA